MSKTVKFWFNVQIFRVHMAQKRGLWLKNVGALKNIYPEGLTVLLKGQKIHAARISDFNPPCFPGDIKP